VLTDGVVGGTWKIARRSGTAILTVRPFRRLSGMEIVALGTEGEALLRFAAADASDHDVRVEGFVD